MLVLDVTFVDNDNYNNNDDDEMENNNNLDIPEFECEFEVETAAGEQVVNTVTVTVVANTKKVTTIIVAIDDKSNSNVGLLIFVCFVLSCCLC